MTGQDKGAIPFAVGRKNNYRVNPEDLYIETRAGYPYYQADRVDLPLVEATVKDMMIWGVELPVRVTKAEIEDHGVMVIVEDGIQRTRHLIEANRRLTEMGESTHNLEVIYEGSPDEDKSFMRSVRLNNHRQDDGVIARARRAYDALTKRGKTVADVAQLFNVSIQCVRDWQAMMECAPSVQKAIAQGQINPTQAVKLAKLNLVEQRVALNELIEASGGKKIKTANVRSIVAQKQGRDISRNELIYRARKALQLLTPDERTALNAEFDQPEMFSEPEEESASFNPDPDALWGI